MTLLGWKANIDKDFVPPQIIDTSPHEIKAKHITNSVHEREFLLQEQLQSKVTGQNPILKSTWSDELDSLVNSYLDNTPAFIKFFIQFATAELSNRALKALKKICKSVIEKMSAILGKEVLLLAKLVGSKTLVTAMESVCVNTAVTISLNIATRLSIYLARALSLISSVVGTFLLVSLVFDIVFSLWDPFGYKNLKPKNYAHFVMEAGENAFRTATERATQVYGFESLMATVLTPDELLNVHIKAFVDQIHYLNELVVNSNGEVIDKGQTVLIDGRNETQWTQANVKALARQHRMNAQTFREYNNTFVHKAKIHSLVNSIASWTAALALLTTVTVSPVFAVLFILVTVLLLFYNRLELESGLLGTAVQEFTAVKTDLWDNSAAANRSMKWFF